MPNHVKNVIKFKNLKPDDIELILNMIASPRITPADPIEKTEYVIDFDKIIPEPRTKKECHKAYLVTKTSRIMKREDKPWFDWYKWHLDHWGTKWGAYDAYTIIGKSYITFVFNTAWTSPIPIITKLKLLGYELDIRYADEDWGSNCGKITWTSEHGWEYQYEESLANPANFARRLWNTY